MDQLRLAGRHRQGQVRPANAGATKLPAVLVIHENRGLNPHIDAACAQQGLDRIARSL